MIWREVESAVVTSNHLTSLLTLHSKPLRIPVNINQQERPTSVDILLIGLSSRASEYVLISVGDTGTSIYC
jgi:hypothetical protein